MEDYHYYTLKVKIDDYEMVATQRYTMLNGEPYFVGDYNYAVFKHPHLVSQGSVMGHLSKTGKINEEVIKKKLQRIIDDRVRYASL